MTICTSAAAAAAAAAAAGSSYAAVGNCIRVQRCGFSQRPVRASPVKVLVVLMCFSPCDRMLIVC